MTVLHARLWAPTRLTAILTALLSCSLTILAWNLGLSTNAALALFSVLAIATLWCYSRDKAVLAALLFFLLKPVMVRVAFMYDLQQRGSGGLDILGLTPALVLAVLIGLDLLIHHSGGHAVWHGSSRLLLLLLLSLAAVSALYTAGSIQVGLAGLERNFIPNMLILILAALVLRDPHAPVTVLKTFLLLGLVSCAYAVGQWWLGVYPWEQDWLSRVAFRDDTVGWLTIGLRGLELRVFSLFYGYMDFFFTNVLIFALVLAGGKLLTGVWRTVRLGYLALWFLILLLTLERMPLIMCAVSVVLYAYLRVPRARRRRVLMLSVLALVFAIGTLRLAAPILLGSGASTLNRIGELANPFSAASIQDRKEAKWGPAIELIRQHPLGVGLGYGSESRANAEAQAQELHVQPHNELLQKALELGVVGAVIYVLFLGSVFRDALRLNRAGARHAWLGGAMVLASVAFWLCGMVNLPFSGSPGLVYWSLAGLVLAQLDASRQESVER